MSLTERLPDDADQRALAVDPTRSFIVQAPAGSGKTSLLTDRILALLARVDRPEQIVAMTFTRKAAAEMHMRVMEKLARATDEQAPEDAHEYQGWCLARAALARDQAMSWGLLSHPARLRIQTIDAFCASLVRAMPWFSGLGGMPRIVQDAPSLYLEAARRTLLMGSQESVVQQVLTHLDLDVEAASQALADMLGKRDQWLPLLGDGDDTDVLEENLWSVLTDDLTQLAQAMPLGWQDALAPIARLAAQALSEEKQSAQTVLQPLEDWMPGELLPDPSHIAQWCAIADLLLTNPGGVRVQITKAIGCPTKSAQKALLQQWLAPYVGVKPAAPWAARLHAVRLMPEPELTGQQAIILKAQLGCLRLCAAQLLTLFAQRGEVDFIEVSQRAVQALGRADDPSDLLLKLDAQLAHVLVDEFQDTSLPQLRLLELLTSGWLPEDGRTAFLVGDPMQSIYRFRKAEVGLFLKVQKKGLGHVPLERLTLTANFRSQGGIVRWVNQTFTQLFPASNDDDMGAITYSKAQEWHPISDAPAVSWHLLDDQPAAWSRVVELAQLAWETHAQSSSPMAILVRSRSHLGAVTRVLRAAGLPCRAIELVALKQQPVINDVLHLARALLHLGDRAAWIGVLRAPWCGLTLGTLHQCLMATPGLTVAQCLARVVGSEELAKTVEASQRARLLSVAQVLLKAIDDDGVMPFAARLEQTWRALEGHRLVGEGSDQEDVQALLRLIENMAEHSFLDVDALERRLHALYAEPAASARAIDVMTMHKAKGLEFESVVLLGLDRQPPPDRVPLLRVEQSEARVLFGPVKPKTETEQDRLALFLGRREATRMAYETDRLIYVAATRARETLHLVACHGLDPKTGDWQSPKKNSLLDRLWPYCPLPPPSAEQPAVVQGTTDFGAQPVWRSPTMWRREHAMALPLKSTSNISGEDRYGWAVSETAERLVGVLIHAWLAHWATAKDAGLALPGAPLVQSQLQALGLPGALRTAAADEVLSALAAMRDSEKGRWLLSQPHRKVEWALLDARQTVSIMDLAIERADEWLVVDYKTARPGPQESLGQFEARMLARYRGQLQRYVAQLQAFDDKPVQAALYFPRDDLWLTV